MTAPVVLLSDVNDASQFADQCLTDREVACMKRGMLDELAELPVTHNPEIKKKVLFKDGDLPSITQYSQATFPPGQRAPAHTHEDMYEVFLCVSGSGLMTIDGEAFALSPGAYVACAPGELHEIANNGSTPLLVHQLGVRAQQ